MVSTQPSSLINSSVLRKLILKYTRLCFWLSVYFIWYTLSTHLKNFIVTFWSNFPAVLINQSPNVLPCYKGIMQCRKQTFKNHLSHSFTKRITLGPINTDQITYCERWIIFEWIPRNSVIVHWLCSFLSHQFLLR